MKIIKYYLSDIWKNWAFKNNYEKSCCSYSGMKERQWLETGSDCCKVRGFLMYLFIIIKFCVGLYEEVGQVAQSV
jgi:hypothetical protein